MANSQDAQGSQHPDALAAVALHALVNEGRDGMTVAELAGACERDPTNAPELNETEAALDVLLEANLATWDGKRFKPTRAAIRAAELSF
ncbi:MAG TPA: hypothetical protein VN845_12215 [Solirubrobacteraceae bacterium]|nr:hypothetical protein [Solirubrobacteraceae bacterium]